MLLIDAISGIGIEIESKCIPLSLSDIIRMLRPWFSMENCPMYSLLDLVTTWAVKFSKGFNLEISIIGAMGLTWIEWVLQAAGHKQMPSAQPLEL